MGSGCKPGRFWFRCKLVVTPCGDPDPPQLLFLCRANHSLRYRRCCLRADAIGYSFPSSGRQVTTITAIVFLCHQWVTGFCLCALMRTLSDFCDCPQEGRSSARRGVRGWRKTGLRADRPLEWQRGLRVCGQEHCRRWKSRVFSDSSRWIPQALSPSGPQALSPSAPQPLSPSAPQPGFHWDHTGLQWGGGFCPASILF